MRKNEEKRKKKENEGGGRSEEEMRKTDEKKEGCMSSGREVKRKEWGTWVVGKKGKKK